LLNTDSKRIVIEELTGHTFEPIVEITLVGRNHVHMMCRVVIRLDDGKSHGEDGETIK